MNIKTVYELYHISTHGGASHPHQLLNEVEPRGDKVGDQANNAKQLQCRFKESGGWERSIAGGERSGHHKLAVIQQCRQERSYEAQGHAEHSVRVCSRG